MCFLSVFLVTFFSPNLRGRTKKKMSKEKKIALLAQCSRPPDWQLTRRTQCVERSTEFFFFLFFISKRWVKQLPVATKVWLFLLHDLSSHAKNVLDSVQPINIANAFVLPRSLAKWEAQTCFRFQIKRTSWFYQSKTSLLSAESTFGNFNRKHSGFWFSVAIKRNSLANAAWPSQDGAEICSKLWRMCMIGNHAFWITNCLRRWSDRLIPSDCAEGESSSLSSSQ